MKFVLIHYKLTYLILIHTSSPTSHRAHLIQTQHHVQRPAHEQTPRSTSSTSLSEVHLLSGPLSLEEAGLGCGIGLSQFQSVRVIPTIIQVLIQLGQ
jgi:hypothetical protein